MRILYELPVAAIEGGLQIKFLLVIGTDEDIVEMSTPLRRSSSFTV
jgi:hypothetical protein